MSKNLVNRAGSSEQDNLIAKLFPPAEPFGVMIAAGQGMLARGTVLALGEDGIYTMLGAKTAGKAENTVAEPAEGSGESETPSGEPTGAATADAETTGKANCILADPVDASGESPVPGVAYRTGHFNTSALIVAEGYELTVTDKEELRKGGILLSAMLD